MRVAVIYTGLLRTIRKTIVFLKRNLLLNENVHIFAVLQGSPEEEPWIREQLEGHCKSLTWFNAEDVSWIVNRNTLVDQMKIPDHWKHYLVTSGSMVEHYQAYLAYRKILEYEEENGFTYDYLIRTRTDIVFTQPVDFYWLRMTESDIEAHLKEVMVITGDSCPGSKTNIMRFMSSILHPGRLKVERELGPSFYRQDDHKLKHLESITDMNTIAKSLHEFIHKGKYIFTLRENLVYFIKRKYYKLIPLLGVSYGMFKMPENEYWFNSESQFKQVCLDSGLSIFDYTAPEEGASLYDYDTRVYFDENDELRPLNIYFFLMRH